MSTSNIRAFKMVDGSEMIAEVVSQSLTGTPTFTVKKAITLAQTNQGIGFAPWTILNPDAEFTFDDTKYIVTYEVPKMLEEQYLSLVSGIQIAKAVPPAPRISTDI